MTMNMQKHLAFIKTAEFGSFTKAAAELNYSQSGVSRMVSDLESEWNVILLDRGKTGATLTSDGMKLLPYAKAMYSDYALLQEQVDEINGLESGLIRIAAISSIMTNMLPARIKKFQQDYPNIDYEIKIGDYEDTERWILDGTVDCGFTHLPAPEGLETYFLHEDQLMAVIPTDHPLANEEVFPIEAISGEPFMMLEKGIREEILAILKPYSIVPDTRFTAWEEYSIISMIENGLGISILPEKILSRTNFNVLIKPLSVPASRQICFAVKKQRNQPLAVRKFMEYIID